MPFISIDDLQDTRLEIYRDLPKRAQTRWPDRFIVESRLVVGRALESDLQVLSVLCSEREQPRLERAAERWPALPIYVVPADLVSQLVGYKLHRGQLACAKRPIDATVADWQAGNASLVVVCPHVTDPVNLAGVIRNCAAFGADGLLLSRKSADPFTRRCVRVSMGTVFRQSIRVSDDLAADLAQLRAAGFQLYGTVLRETAERLATTKRPPKLALLFGSEGPGLEQQWVDACDRQLTIPMRRDTDSLNLATSTGIALYHFTELSR